MTGMCLFNAAGFMSSRYTEISRVTGMCLLHPKERGKVENNLSIKRKIILIRINSILIIT